MAKKRVCWYLKSIYQSMNINNIYVSFDSANTFKRNCSSFIIPFIEFSGYNFKLTSYSDLICHHEFDFVYFCFIENDNLYLCL